MCGGTRCNGGRQMSGRGLSPRVRGNPIRRRIPRGSPGSIPACAGEPPFSISSIWCFTVYPRVCGGTRFACFLSFVSSGLSPRVRGNPVISAAGFLLSRSIPACAGEPSSYRTAAPPRGVYPRVCGGTLSSPPLADGPSPHRLRAPSPHCPALGCADR